MRYGKTWYWNRKKTQFSSLLSRVFPYHPSSSRSLPRLRLTQRCVYWYFRPIEFNKLFGFMINIRMSLIAALFTCLNSGKKNEWVYPKGDGKGYFWTWSASSIRTNVFATLLNVACIPMYKSVYVRDKYFNMLYTHWHACMSIVRRHTVKPEGLKFYFPNLLIECLFHPTWKRKKCVVSANRL